MKEICWKSYHVRINMLEIIPCENKYVGKEQFIATGQYCSENTGVLLRESMCQHVGQNSRLKVLANM